jgi:hypothetical protein
VPSNIYAIRMALALIVGAATMLFASSAAAEVLTSPQLTMLVARAAESGVVESAEAADTTAANAAMTLTPELSTAYSEMSQSSAETPVILVVMHGYFVDTLAKNPPHTPAPSGHTMSFIFNPATGRVAALSVGEVQPAISALGVVEQFVTPPADAKIGRARARLLPKDRPRHQAHTAKWGTNNECGYKVEDHCYMTASWKGEKVEGTQELQETTTMDVPGSASGYFVDNEEWTSFGENKWIEAGQQGGGYKGCCTLWWFYAGSYGAKASEYFVYEDAPYVWEVKTNQYNEYEMKSINPTTPTWCIYIAPNFETQHACFSSSKWAVYSSHLEAGAEVATEEKPAFVAYQTVNGQHLSGYWYGWGSSTAYETETAGLCYSYIGPTPGDMKYSTC